MIKRTAKVNLEFEVKDYPGNYEREFVSYVFGVLDDVQYFGGDEPYCPEYLEMFWKEVMGVDNFDTSECFINTNFNAQDFTKKEITPYRPYMDFSKYSEYRIFDDYLQQVFAEVDEWSQFTFYKINCWENGVRRNTITIYLKQELSEDLLKQTIDRALSFNKVFPNMSDNNFLKISYKTKKENKVLFEKGE